MDETLFWIVSIIAPLILLGILIWLAVQSGRGRNRARDMSDAPADTKVSAAYREDEQARREGTDGL